MSETYRKLANEMTEHEKSCTLIVEPDKYIVLKTLLLEVSVDNRQTIAKEVMYDLTSNEEKITPFCCFILGSYFYFIYKSLKPEEAKNYSHNFLCSTLASKISRSKNSGTQVISVDVIEFTKTMLESYLIVKQYQHCSNLIQSLFEYKFSESEICNMSQQDIIGKMKDKNIDWVKYPKHSKYGTFLFIAGSQFSRHSDLVDFKNVNSLNF